jgi:hypothetical protein
MNRKTLLTLAAVLAATLASVDGYAKAQTTRTSGVYPRAADYQNNRLSFAGSCGSKAHKLELHDVLNKSYIDVTHESEKHRYLKKDLFGFRACDGRDYRFTKNLEYQILESKELYIYAREMPESRGKGFHTAREYYFSAGPNGPILELTLDNLKQAAPDNHKFHDSLDATFGTGQKLAEYDEFHKMFKVNRLLIASREP